jgi:hypothetical protein
VLFRHVKHHAGNKTSHAAALLHTIAITVSGGKKRGKAKVFALDRDAQRLAILKRRVGDTERGGMGYGPQMVVPLNQDFLQLDPADPRMGKASGSVMSIDNGEAIDRSIDRSNEASHFKSFHFARFRDQEHLPRSYFPLRVLPNIHTGL